MSNEKVYVRMLFAMSHKLLLSPLQTENAVETFSDACSCSISYFLTCWTSHMVDAALRSCSKKTFQSSLRTIPLHALSSCKVVVFIFSFSHLLVHALICFRLLPQISFPKFFLLLLCC